MLSNCMLKMEVLLPNYMRPAKPIFEASGNLVIKASLGGQLKKFIMDLEEDYQAWARDDP